MSKNNSILLKELSKIGVIWAETNIKIANQISEQARHSIDRIMRSKIDGQVRFLVYGCILPATFGRAFKTGERKKTEIQVTFTGKNR